MRERERLLRPERDFLERRDFLDFLRDRRDFLRWQRPSAPKTHGDLRERLRRDLRDFLDPERRERLDFLTLQEVDNFLRSPDNFLEYLALALANLLIRDFDLDLRLTILF